MDFILVTVKSFFGDWITNSSRLNTGIGSEPVGLGGYNVDSSITGPISLSLINGAFPAGLLQV